MIKRRNTRQVKIGNIKIGGGSPITIQSMAKTDTANIAKTVREINKLEKAGCEIIRLAVKNMSQAEAIGKIKNKINIPLVCDIHFNYRLALKAISQGADCIRLNPGNINKKSEIKQIAEQAKKSAVPIRVGVNSGSLTRKSSSLKNNTVVNEMVKSALDFIKILEDLNFRDIIISLKASNVIDTVAAYRKMAGLCSYPFHLGVTATGTKEIGSIKSSIAIGALLLDGIGDTIRISLTGPAEEEIRAGKGILSSLGLRSFGPEVISCPTCGRCEVDLVKIVEDLEKRLSTIDYPRENQRFSGTQSSEFQRNSRGRLSTRPAKLAVMGCVVNGPGEARDADIGVAFGKGSGMLFKKGERIRKIKEKDVVKTLLKEIIK